MAKTLTDNEIRTLIEKAMDMRSFSYTPYSHFNVGAALLTDGGKIYGGCNIESISFSPTNCAERTAIFKAASEGERNFKAIAICGAYADKEPTEPCPPCGVCRQVMLEFCEPDFKVILAVSTDNYQIYDLNEIIPLSFTLLNKD